MGVRPLAAAVLTALVLAGCGGSDADVATPTAFPAAEATADQAIAARLVLTQADMPTGYAALPTNPIPAIPAVATQPEACKSAIGDGVQQQPNTASLVGAGFQSSGGQSGVTISSLAVLSPSADAAALQQGIWTQSKNNLCARRLLEPVWRTILPSGAVAGSSGSDLNLQVLNSLAGEGYGAVRLIGSTNVNRQVANVYLDVIAARADRAMVVAMIAGAGTEPSTDDERHVAAQLTKRLTDALVAASKPGRASS